MAAFLLEPGPLTLIVDADFPTRPLVPAFAGLAARELEQLGLADGTLAGAHGVLVGAAAPSDAIAGGLALGAAESELAGQAGAADPSIGAVAGSAATLEGTLAGLMGESARDLNAAVPDAPYIPRGDDIPENYPGDEWTAYDQNTIGLYQYYLGRPPSNEELAIHRGNPRGMDGVRDAIVNSEEYRNRQGRPADAPPSGDDFAAAVRGLYADLLGREPGGSEIDSHRGNPNGIDGVRAAILASDEYRARQGG